jgi:hypothetical protein
MTLRFNPLTQILSTDDGAFLKAVDCPLGISENGLVGATTKHCLQCHNSVVSIKGMSDHEISDFITKNQDQCLSFSLTDENIKVTYDGSFL